MGDFDGVFRDPDDALVQREIRLPHVTYYGDLAPLRKDPRIQEFLVRVGVAYRRGGRAPLRVERPDHRAAHGPERAECGHLAVDTRTRLTRPGPSGGARRVSSLPARRT